MKSSNLIEVCVEGSTCRQLAGESRVARSVLRHPPRPTPRGSGPAFAPPQLDGLRRTGAWRSDPAWRRALDPADEEPGAPTSSPVVLKTTTVMALLAGLSLMAVNLVAVALWMSYLRESALALVASRLLALVPGLIGMLVGARIALNRTFTETDRGLLGFSWMAQVAIGLGASHLPSVAVGGSSAFLCWLTCALHAPRLVPVLLRGLGLWMLLVNGSLGLWLGAQFVMLPAWLDMGMMVAALIFALAGLCAGCKLFEAEPDPDRLAMYFSIQAGASLAAVVMAQNAKYLEHTAAVLLTGVTVVLLCRWDRSR